MMKTDSLQKFTSEFEFKLHVMTNFWSENQKIAENCKKIFENVLEIKNLIVK